VDAKGDAAAHVLILAKTLVKGLAKDVAVAVVPA